MRRVDIAWTGAEVAQYDQLAALSEQTGEVLPQYAKRALRNALGGRS